MASSSLQSDKLFNVRGMVAVVTGGGTGIGLMMANALAENGATKVYIIGRREEVLKEAAKKYPGVMIPVCGDVTSKSSLEQVSTTILQDIGYINLLITNAGTGGPGLKGVPARPSVGDFVKAAWQSPMTEFNDVYALNCSSVYYTILAFLELLDKGNKQKNCAVKSQVIATASMASYMRDPRWGFAYCSSKAALVSMIKCFATYCVPWGIRFNAIAAGLFPSDMSMPLLAPFKISKEKELSEEGAFAKSYLPAERAGSEEDIAGTVIYLASQAGAYVNGSIMLLDGGKLAIVPSTY